MLISSLLVIIFLGLYFSIIAGLALIHPQSLPSSAYTDRRKEYKVVSFCILEPSSPQGDEPSGFGLISIKKISQELQTVTTVHIHAHPYTHTQRVINNPVVKSRSYIKI